MPPDRMAQIDIWGNVSTPFVTARERYGTWPTTVWPVDYADRFTLDLKEAIGDIGKAGAAGQTRDGSFTPAANNKSLYAGKITASVFSPQVAQWVLNMFAPTPPANVYDPFGGGGTRGILAAASGFTYIGIEIRPEETAAVRARIERAGVADQASFITGDSRERHVPVGWADFLITCPPYYDMEKYRGPDGDLSMAATYEDFLVGLSVVIGTAAEILRPGALAAWVMGLIRDAKGALVPLHHDIADLHRAHGYTFREEVVLHLLNTGAIQRVGKFDQGHRRLIRTHEYLHIYQREEVAATTTTLAWPEGLFA